MIIILANVLGETYYCDEGGYFVDMKYVNEHQKQKFKLFHDIKTYNTKVLYTPEIK